MRSVVLGLLLLPALVLAIIPAEELGGSGSFMQAVDRASTRAGVSGILPAVASAFDESKYPQWRGQWRRIGGIQWDPSRKLGLDEQPPLKPQYQRP